MSLDIVLLAVSQTTAPAPSNLQQTGAIISVGGTTLAAGTRSLLTQESDITALLAPALANSALVWSGSLVTVTTVAAHGITVGQTLDITIAGAVPTGYNGTFAGTSTGANTFTYPLVSSPGAETSPGTWVPAAASNLVPKATTFFAQGSQLSVYVLELGINGTAAAITALNTYIGNNPSTFYSYLVPKGWPDDASYATFTAQFEALDAKTYFFTTVSNSNYASIAATQKAVLALIPAPAAPTSEFTMAAPFYKALNYNPSSSNRITPFDYSNLLDVTNYPLPGNGALLQTYINAGVNYVGTGAEGGLTNTILRDGTTMDLRDFQYWFSTDWVQINVKRNVAAAIINGSNSPQNPLYYDQDGINRLQAVIASTMTTGVTVGAVFGSPTQVSMSPTDFAQAVDNGTYAGLTPINAWDFVDYSLANPNDYAAGRYTGFQIAFTPKRGFKQILISINVSDFPVS